jgi:hypothetical protein
MAAKLANVVVHFMTHIPINHIMLIVIIFKITQFAKKKNNIHNEYVFTASISLFI